MNHDSSAEIRAVLDSRGLSLKKRWGQNFLVNQAARERLVSLLQPGAREIVWEIGAGLGSMTEILLPRAERLVAFEVDWGLCRYLADRFRSEPRFTLVCGDFLETWENAVRDHGRPNRILGNLPYSSASLMVAQILESYRAQDNGNNASSPVASGFERIFLSPGLELDFNSIMLYADAELPVYEHITGNQLVAPVLVKFIVAYRF